MREAGALPLWLSLCLQGILRGSEANISWLSAGMLHFVQHDNSELIPLRNAMAQHPLDREASCGRVSTPNKKMILPWAIGHDTLSRIAAPPSDPR